MSVKEPEAKTKDELTLAFAAIYSKLVNGEEDGRIKSLIRSALHDAEKIAVGFADARVKEATDKLKQEMRDYYESFLSPTMIDVKNHKVALEQASEMFRIKFRKFLEEAKPTP